MVKRLDNWPKLLSAYLRERQAMPFEWGVNDCMAFVAKCVDRLTGEDFFSSFNDYNNEASAQVMLEANGGPYGIITQCLGSPIDEIMMGQRGDVAIVNMPEVHSGINMLTGGIIDDTGQRIAVVTAEGLRRVPIMEAIRVWSY